MTKNDRVQKLEEYTMAHIIFYFSGTGNSLKVTKTIADELGNGEIVSMTKAYSLTKQYDTIGFIYPVYFWGLPKKVINFIENLTINGNNNAYYYSIATYGGDVGNAVYQMYALFHKRHAIKLNYCQKLKMFANYVVMYDMSENIDAITEKSNKNLIPIIDAIKNRKNNAVNKLTAIFSFINKNFGKNVASKDRYFSVNSNCRGCGICLQVCPVNNITMQNNKPFYNHICEQCVACIQFCPERAINYKNVTQNRRRYTHPDISAEELSSRNRQ
jgi:ferredoxin